MPTISKHLFSLFRIGLAAGLLYYLVRSGSINWSSLTRLGSVWHFTVLAIILFFSATVLQAWRLQILINAYRLNLGFSSSVRLTFIGLFFNTYLPGATGGDLAKIYYASKGNPGSRTEVITILLMDRFIGLLSLLALPLLLAPWFIPVINSQKVLQILLGSSLLITLGIVFVTILASRYDPSNSRLIRFVENRVVLGSKLKRALYTLHYYRDHKNVLFKAVLISLVSHFIMVWVSLVISEATNPTGADSRMIILIPMAYFANSLPVTPGGLGIGEAAMESLFKLFSLQGGAEVILGWRLVMILVGLIGLAFYLKGEKRFVFSDSKKQLPNEP